MRASVYHRETPYDVLHLLDKLPVTHTFGDEKSVLQNGDTLQGTQQLEQYYPRKSRVAIRTHIFDCVANAFGGYGGCSHKIEYKTPRNVLLTLVAVPDWQTEDIDPFIRDVPDVLQIKIGTQFFWPVEYMTTILLHLSNMFQALKQEIAKQRAEHPSKKAYIKFSPLAIGPTIQTRYGIRICNVIAPWYTQAIALAINAYVDCSWVQTIEFIDFANIMSSLKAYLVCPKDVTILYPSKRDVLDFTDVSQDLIAVSICPVDSMSAPWKKKEQSVSSLASAALHNTNVFDHSLQWTSEINK